MNFKDNFKYRNPLKNFTTIGLIMVIVWAICASANADGVIHRNSGNHIVSGVMNKAHLNKEKLVLIGASYAKGWNVRELGGMYTINKGVNGEQSFEMLARFKQDVLSQRPKSVLIWGFINDIFRSDPNKIEESKERTRESIREMVRLSRINKITPILATEITILGRQGWRERLSAYVGMILGKKSYQEYINGHVKNINAWIRHYAEEEQLIFIDLEKALASGSGERRKEYAASDGSHISEAGYSELTRYSSGRLDEYFHSKSNLK